jgi:catechol 2,3-dioxygenase-like lactoylglutathione lyase family enzyme
VISGLHHYALEVPDLEVADGFLQDFGLETGEKDGSLVAKCPGREQEQVRMVQAPAKRLHHVTFTLQPGSMDTIREALERAGTPVIEPPAGATEDGLWISDPDGTAVQLLDEAPAPARPVAEVLVNMGASRQRIGVAQWTQATEDVLPRRLGHSLLFTAQPERMTEFYTGVLGLRISDTIHGLVTFLNAGAGDHHVFGFIASSHRGFHHASFEVPSVDAIAIGADRMRAKGREAGWAGTPSGRTSSTTTPTPGARGSSGSPTSTRSTTAGWPTTGTCPRTCGERRPPRLSSPTTSHNLRRSEA